MQKSSLLGTLVLMVLYFSMEAQSPLSGFMNGKGRGAIALSSSMEQYDEVFLVPNDANGVPVFEEVDINSTSLFASYGISDRLDVVMTLPYIKTTGNASETVLNRLGFENTRSGVQDLSVFVKYNPFSTKVGESDLNFLIGAGLRTPLGDYRVDEGLQSILAIGNRATSFNGLAIAKLRTPSGIFLTTQAGYSFRNNEVPNALLGEIKLGYAGSRIYAEAWYAGQISKDGVNILGEGFAGFFPATDVSYTRAGASVYVPIIGGFGVSGGINQYLTGRNIGKATGYFGGLVLTF
ncbi:MAG: hypothetical protein HC912_07585 [Saprospiraceae bacterium]|nr:hypothetical protein [Saprospiraceae bacterium]